MLQVITENPFFILGTTAEASVKQRIANVSKLKAYAKVKKAIIYDTDLPFLPTPNRSVESIDKAVASLNLPHDLIQASLFWYHTVTPTQQQAFNLLVSNNVEQAKALLMSNFENYATYLDLAFIYFTQNKNKEAIQALNNVLYDKTLREDFFTGMSKIYGHPITLQDKDVIELELSSLLLSLNVKMVATIFADKYVWPMNIINRAHYDQIAKHIADEPYHFINTIIQKCEDNEENGYTQDRIIINYIYKSLNKIKKAMEQMADIFGTDSIDYQTTSNKLANNLVSISQRMLTRCRILGVVSKNNKLSTVKEKAIAILMTAEQYFYNKKDKEQFLEYCNSITESKFIAKYKDKLHSLLLTIDLSVAFNNGYRLKDAKYIDFQQPYEVIDALYATTETYLRPLFDEIESQHEFHANLVEMCHRIAKHIIICVDKFIDDLPYDKASIQHHSNRILGILKHMHYIISLIYTPEELNERYQTLKKLSN